MSTLYLDDCGCVSWSTIQEVRELERKAALWDKVSAISDGTVISYSDVKNPQMKWEIEHPATHRDYYGDTLEEALNAIPEVQS